MPGFGVTEYSVLRNLGRKSQVLGFSLNMQSEFVHKYYNLMKDNSIIQELLQRLKSDSMVKSLASSPLTLSFLCAVATDSGPEIFPQTKRELYEALVECMLQRSANKLDNIDVTQGIDDLAELAYYGIINNISMYVSTDPKVKQLIQKSDSPLHLGFLTKRQSTRLLVKSEAYCFLHKTVQEFFCACHICSVVQQDKEETVRLLNMIWEASEY